MTLVEKHQFLAQVMATARRRAGADHDTSCWEKLEEMLRVLEHKIEHAKPVVPAPQPRAPRRSVYDIDHARALRLGARGGLSS
jgi:hypothetical protein